MHCGAVFYTRSIFLRCLRYRENVAGSQILAGASINVKSFGTVQVGDEVPDVAPSALKSAWEATQQLLRQRKISAGHDISDGGLAVTLLEMAFSGNTGISVSHSLHVPDSLLKNHLLEDACARAVQSLAVQLVLLGPRFGNVNVQPLSSLSADYRWTSPGTDAVLTVPLAPCLPRSWGWCWRWLQRMRQRSRPPMRHRVCQPLP